MSNELVKASPVSVPAIAQRRRCRCWSSGQGGRHASPGMNSSMPSTTTRTRKKPIMRAVRRFLAWAEGQGVELAGDHAGHGRPVPRRPGRLARQAEPAPVGVTRLLRPAGQPACRASSTRRRRCKGVKDQVIEGKTPEITIEQARTLLASVDTGHVVGLRDRAILATLAYTACRAGAVAKLRLGDFQHDGHAIRAAVSGEGRQEPGNPGAARSGGLYPGLCRGGGHRGRGQGYAAVPGGATAGAGQLTAKPLTHEADLRAGQAAAERCRAAVAAVAAFVPGDGDHRPADAGRAAGGRAIPGRARGAANDRALRPAAEEGDAEHRRADFDLSDGDRAPFLPANTHWLQGNAHQIDDRRV